MKNLKLFAFLSLAFVVMSCSKNTSKFTEQTNAKESQKDSVNILLSSFLSDILQVDIAMVKFDPSNNSYVIGSLVYQKDSVLKLYESSNNYKITH